MSDVKPFSTYSEQIQKLIDRGCIINDISKCESVLRNVGYYRLSAYFLPYKTGEDKYENGLTFDKIYQVYEFDRELRQLLLPVLEEIEVSMRARLAYFHSGKYGALGYLDPATFNNKHNDISFKETLNREINNNKKVHFVKHHMKNYNGKFPLWVISELFSFGTTSYFYNALKTADKKAFAGIKYKKMSSWLKCCATLRNICAHYGRLYFRVFTSTPAGFSLSEAQKCRLWGAILCVRALYQFPQKWDMEFVPQLQGLFRKYGNAISLYHIAFPDDWDKQLRSSAEPLMSVETV